jgi:hypothetical protein
MWSPWNASKVDCVILIVPACSGNLKPHTCLCKWTYVTSVLMHVCMCKNFGVVSWKVRKVNPIVSWLLLLLIILIIKTKTEELMQVERSRGCSQMWNLYKLRRVGRPCLYLECHRVITHDHSWSHMTAAGHSGIGEGQCCLLEGFLPGWLGNRRVSWGRGGLVWANGAGALEVCFEMWGEC